MTVLSVAARLVATVFFQLSGKPYRGRVEVAAAAC